jgi:hypothetical protein
MTERHIMTGPKIFEDVQNQSIRDLGFKIGKPLTEDEFLKMKKTDNIKLLQAKPEMDLHEKLHVKLKGLKNVRTNHTINNDV